MVLENLLYAYRLHNAIPTQTLEKEFWNKFGHLFLENKDAYIDDYVDGEEGDSRYSEFGHTVDGIYTVTYQESCLPGDRSDYNFNFEYINTVCPELKEWIMQNFHEVPNTNNICYYPIFRKDIPCISGEAIAVFSPKTHGYSLTTDENLQQYGYICIGGEAFVAGPNKNGVYTLAKPGKSMQHGYASAANFWDNRPQTIYIPKDIVFSEGY